MSNVLAAVYVLMITAAVFFVAGGLARFIRHHEGTVWWRGAVGFLAFAQTLLLLEILRVLTVRVIP